MKRRNKIGVKNPIFHLEYRIFCAIMLPLYWKNTFTEIKYGLDNIGKGVPGLQTVPALGDAA